MFEEPDAKRSVRRSELYAPEGSDDGSERHEEGDPGLQRVLKERLERLYGPVASSAIGMATTSNARERSAEPDDGAPAEFEFRLFATDHGGDERVSGQRIVLEDEDEEVGEGGLVHPRRHRSYYFSTLALGPELAAFQHAALSGEDILQLSKSRNFGLEVPWRVRVVKGVGMVTRKRKEGPIGEGCVGVEGQGKRTRAGKKRRIVLRERQRKRVKEEEERKKKGEEKEGREREKRVRRNREKKIKRREKERMEKARKAAGGEGIEQSSS